MRRKSRNEGGKSKWHEYCIIIYQSYQVMEITRHLTWNPAQCFRCKISWVPFFGSLKGQAGESCTTACNRTGDSCVMAAPVFRGGWSRWLQMPATSRAKCHMTRPQNYESWNPLLRKAECKGTLRIS